MEKIKKNNVKAVFSDANQIIERQLLVHLQELEKHFRADCLSYSGPIMYGADDFIRNAVENIPEKKGRLIFVLETHGGYAEVVRRISDTIRHHYKIVDFLIPSHAMSAGTILAMSGDAIFMDYYSVLGPIDPQVESKDGQLIPALGYLIRYNQLLDKANAGKISPAEMAVLLDFDQGELYSYEQARDLSRTLLEEWLAKYKFKDWKKTATRKVKVTKEMKQARAKEVADKLNNVRKWNSHGIGISMEVLRRDLNLKVDDFSENPDLAASVRCYHKLLTDYMGKLRHKAIVHTREGYRAFLKG